LQSLSLSSLYKEKKKTVGIEIKRKSGLKSFPSMMNEVEQNLQGRLKSFPLMMNEVSFPLMMNEVQQN